MPSCGRLRRWRFRRRTTARNQGRSPSGCPRVAEAIVPLTLREAIRIPPGEELQTEVDVDAIPEGLVGTVSPTDRTGPRVFAITNAGREVYTSGNNRVRITIRNPGLEPLRFRNGKQVADLQLFRIPRRGSRPSGSLSDLFRTVAAAVGGGTLLAITLGSLTLGSLTLFSLAVSRAISGPTATPFTPTVVANVTPSLRPCTAIISEETILQDRIGKLWTETLRHESEQGEEKSKPFPALPDLGTVPDSSSCVFSARISISTGHGPGAGTRKP